MYQLDKAKFDEEAAKTYALSLKIHEESERVFAFKNNHERMQVDLEKMKETLAEEREQIKEEKLRLQEV